ncbi:MAG: hypothetical protein Q3979_08310 [Actinomycetaceae bacterium]|nr:hypothetical protein [Actinomycetaceae bacterium]
MSSFFKRNRKKDLPDEARQVGDSAFDSASPDEAGGQDDPGLVVTEVEADADDAAEAVQAEVVEEDADAPGVEGAEVAERGDRPAEDSGEQSQPESEPPIELSRRARVTLAYARWYHELSEVVEESAEPIDGNDTAVVNLSSPHPTGASQLYSGMPTLLTSLVREETAQREARARLAELRLRINALSEQYGYAPVTLAIGRISWTEPPIDLEDGEAGLAQYGYADDPDADPASIDLLPAGGAAGESGASTGDTAGGAASSGGGAGDAGAPTGNAARAKASGSSGEGRRAERRAPKVRQMHEAGLLRTVRFDPSGPDDAYITLTARSEINPALIRALRAHGTRPGDIGKLRTLAADASREDEALARLCELSRIYLPGFTYENLAVLGCFVHPAQVLLSDLEAMKPYIEESGVMTALAGDEETRRLSSAPLPPAEVRDRFPEAERGAGDRDPAELSVIEAVASGRSVVVDTPPGSEAMGTLAGIVADAAASGRNVLYIPGRASAGGALVEEMERIGLGDLVLDFSDLDGVAHRIRTGMRLRTDEEDIGEILDLRAELTSARRELADYIGSLHEVDPRWGESVHSLLERLALLTARPDAPKSRVRLTSDALQAASGQLDDIRAALEEAAELGVYTTAVQSPWKGAHIHSEADGERALALAKRMADDSLPVVIAHAERTAEETGLTPARTFADWLEQVGVLEGISHSLDIFLPQIFERSAQDLVIATASKEWREAHGEEMRGSLRRRLTKQAKDFVRPGASSSDLHADLVTVQRQREVWRRYCEEGGWPKLPEGMTQVRASTQEVTRQIDQLEEVLGEDGLSDLPMRQLLERVQALAGDDETMARLPRANEITADLRARGLGDVIDDFAERKIGRNQVAGELELIHASSIFEQLVGRSPVLARTTPTALLELASEVRRLDRAHTRTLSAPVSRAVVRIMRETISGRRDDTMALDAQLEKYSTGILRDAIATYPQIVQTSRPVWVIPAMIAAEFVPPMPWADLVVMDEQDSVSLASTVSMFMRGHQIVVMGNLRRAEGSDAAITQFAKVLPVCTLPTLRAQHDELAAQTLREQGYGDVLEMVPSAKRSRRPRLVVVDGRGVPNPQTGLVEGTQAEVDAVVDAIVEHALTQPERSLGVVSASEAHAARIRDAIRRLASGSPQLGAFLSDDRREPFVILELDKAAGLHRDSIIFTVGFGKTVHGRVLHSFGCLSTATGLTGLVDTIEAPREELTIVSSLGPGEIDASRVSMPGPLLLEKLIERASGREVTLEPDESGRDLGPLLGDLAARLRAAGWSVALDFGFDDGVRIPLVAGHPSFEGTWRVAVLADSEAYVAEPSLRRRDRYWLERLEARGWTVLQTFSTSLFIDPIGQADIVKAALEQTRRVEARARVRDGGVKAPARAGGAGNGAGGGNGAAGVAGGDVAGRDVADGGASGGGGAATVADAAAAPAGATSNRDASGRKGAVAADGGATAGSSAAGGGSDAGGAVAAKAATSAGADAGREAETKTAREPAAPEVAGGGAPEASPPGEGAGSTGGDAGPISEGTGPSGGGAGSSGSSGSPDKERDGEPSSPAPSRSDRRKKRSRRQIDGAARPATEVAAAGDRRDKRPDVQAGLPLSVYADSQLTDVLEWIASDGRPRTEEELVGELREELAIPRRGSQTDVVLRNVVARSGLATRRHRTSDGKSAPLPPSPEGFHE